MMDSGSAPPAAEGSPRPLRLGLMLFHGMGKQPRYATLTEITQAVQSALGIRADGFKISEYTHRGYQDQQVQLRTELDDGTGRGTTRQVEITLFEMYWAPLVRGAVGLLDVLLWLASSAFAALRKLRGIELKANIEQLQERYRAVDRPRFEATPSASGSGLRGWPSRSPIWRAEQFYARTLRRVLIEDGRARKVPAWFKILYWFYNFGFALGRFVVLVALAALVFGHLSWLVTQLAIGITNTCYAVAAEWPTNGFMTAGAFRPFWAPLIYFLLLCVCVNGLAIVLRAPVPVLVRPLLSDFSPLGVVLRKILSFSIAVVLVVGVYLVGTRYLAQLLADKHWLVAAAALGKQPTIQPAAGFELAFWSCTSIGAILSVFYVIARSQRAGWRATLERGVASLVLAAGAVAALVMTYRIQLLWDLAAVLLPLVLFLWIRLFLVAWMGDVLLMTDADETAKTYPMRRRVIRCAVERLEYLFGQPVGPLKHAVAPSTGPRYEGDLPDFDRVIIAGHSLGSHVAYLGLCEYFSRLREIARLNPPAAPAGKGGAPDYLAEFHRKFCLFLTYGSPLDRVRFFFDSGSSGSEVTDTLCNLHEQHKGAHSTSNQAFYRAGWLNLYCLTDIVSTKLVRFGALVRNEHIWSLLWPPVVCHSFYLADPFVLQVLRDEVTSCA